MRNAHDPSQRKYKCDVCGKCYLTKSILERHKGTHTLIKPYKVSFEFSVLKFKRQIYYIFITSTKKIGDKFRSENFFLEA